MSKKYFINNLDTAFGQALLSELVKEPTEEPVHMCTVRIPVDQKPNGIRKILKREKPKLFRKKAIEECDVYVYNLHQTDISDVEFGIETMNKPFEQNKVFIFISDIMAWSGCERKVKREPPPPAEEQEPAEEENKKQEVNDQGSDEAKEGNEDGEEEAVQPKEEEEEEKPIQYTFFEDADFNEREPLPAYCYIKEIEDRVLSIQKENVKVFVICPGIVYGCGEDTFYPLFRAAWLQDPNPLPFIGGGENVISTIHLKDLVRFVVKVAENPPEGPPYLLAFDETKDKQLKSIVQGISVGVGSGTVRAVDKSDLFQTPEIFLTNIDIRPSKFLVGTAEQPAEFDWVAKNGLKENIKGVLQEFCTKHHLRPLKLLFLQGEDDWRKQSKIQSIYERFSKYYRIPVLEIKKILEQARANAPEELRNHLAEEWTSITQYIQSREQRKLDETMKVFYRAIRWRLSQNDCLNRGYILDNFPHFFEQLQYIFLKVSDKKLKRKEEKKKKVQAPKDENQGEDGEQKPEEQQKEEEGEAQGEGEDEKEGPNTESSYPQSIISIKRMGAELPGEVIEFFSHRGMEELVYDTTGVKDHEIFQSLRSHIERNGRPNNYLIEEEKLFESHKQFTIEKDKQKIAEREAHKKKEEEAIKQVERNRKKLAEEIAEVVGTEGEQNYLMEFVVPTLNEGLLEVSNIIPNDPVDLLAEYLYQKSYDF